jgi:hypothetical protein
MGSVGNRGEWQRHASAADGHKVPNQASEKSTSEGGVSARSDRSRADGIYNDCVRAGAWSLRHPYYSHFLYSPDDYRN